ncbi:MAG: hypothetical protein OXS30_05430 [Chloroflexota bacterium]|nr:hypothetical protein [Chloroflexota bacterium]
MNPILRIRRAFRDFGANAQQADEVVSAVDEYYLSRKEFDDRIRAIMAEQTNRILLGMFVLLSIAVGVILAFVA